MTLVPEKKNCLKPDTKGSFFPTSPKQRSNSPPPEKTSPVKFPTPRAQKIVKCPRFAWAQGMVKFQFEWCIMKPTNNMEVSSGIPKVLCIFARIKRAKLESS